MIWMMASAHFECIIFTMLTPSQYLAFELDIVKGRFRAFQRVGDEWGKIMHEKPLNRTAPPWAARPARRAGLSGAGAGLVRMRAEDTLNVVPLRQVV